LPAAIVLFPFASGQYATGFLITGVTVIDGGGSVGDMLVGGKVGDTLVPGRGVMLPVVLGNDPQAAFFSAMVAPPIADTHSPYVLGFTVGANVVVGLLAIACVGKALHVPLIHDPPVPHGDRLVRDSSSQAFPMKGFGVVVVVGVAAGAALHLPKNHLPPGQPEQLLTDPKTLQSSPALRAGVGVSVALTRGVLVVAGAVQVVPVPLPDFVYPGGHEYCGIPLVSTASIGVTVTVGIAVVTLGVGVVVGVVLHLPNHHLPPGQLEQLLDKPMTLQSSPGFSAGVGVSVAVTLGVVPWVGFALQVPFTQEPFDPHGL
jgi:hypothetical protein